MRVFILALALTGCATAASAPPGSNFGREVAGRLPGTARSCIDTIPSQSVRALDSATLGYDQGPVLWANRLRSHCPGLSPAITVIIESRTGQYCSGDHVRGLDQGGNIPGPVCLLGEWTPYR
ncbi:MAG: hypothetical protein M3Q19_03335 [Pseudomonadota bacterium]|nr:hypothetical protein [Pseudomonadota bacterium]